MDGSEGGGSTPSYDFVFAGGDDYFLMDNQDNDIYRLNAFYLECEIYFPAPWASGVRYVWSQTNDNGSTIRLQANEEARFYAFQNGTIHETASALSAGEWITIGMECDGADPADIGCYVNGVEVGTGTSGTNNSTADVFFGLKSNGADPWVGRIKNILLADSFADRGTPLRFLGV